MVDMDPKKMLLAVCRQWQLLPQAANKTADRQTYFPAI